MDPVFHLSTYDYPLDERLIAQFPSNQRDQAQLLVLHRGSLSPTSGVTGRLEHRLFTDILQYLKPGDLLVLNDTRVIPAQLVVRKVPTGGCVKVLLLRVALPDANPFRWEALIQGSVAIEQRLRANGGLEIKVLERFQDGRWLVDLVCDGDLFEVLDRVGLPPLPPYIRRPALESDRLRYQTIYARSAVTVKESGGSIAAPTAGLHFTEALLEKIRAQGVKLAFITLHIGHGTFRAVRSSDIRRHRMDPEYYEISLETARLIEETRTGGGRIIAVGTSTTRVLEAAVARKGPLSGSGMTDLFIFPRYRFNIVQGLITNFHMPKSTLFMLVSAFSGIEALKEAYAEAVRMHYCFLSFGDAMLIL